MSNLLLNTSGVLQPTLRGNHEGAVTGCVGSSCGSNCGLVSMPM